MGRISSKRLMLGSFLVLAGEGPDITRIEQRSQRNENFRPELDPPEALRDYLLKWPPYAAEVSDRQAQFSIDRTLADVMHFYVRRVRLNFE